MLVVKIHALIDGPSQQQSGDYDHGAAAEACEPEQPVGEEGDEREDGAEQQAACQLVA